MQQLLLLFLIFYPLGSAIFAQSKVVKKTEERWNADDAKWDLKKGETWDFDDQGREVSYFIEDHYDDFLYYATFNKTLRKKEFDDFGNVIFTLIHSSSDSVFSEQKTTFQYDDQQRLTEEIRIYRSNYSDDIRQTRITFHYDDLALSERIQIYDYMPDTEAWVKVSDKLLFKNEHGCILKEERENFFKNGELRNRNHYYWTVDENCRPLTYEHWVKSENSDSLYLFEINTYTYSADDRIVTFESETFDLTFNAWVVNYRTETEVDEAGRLIRRFYETMNWEYFSQQLDLYTYNEKGERLTSHQYSSGGWSGIDSLKLYYRDSFVYEYEGDQLLSRVGFYTTYDSSSGGNSTQKSTTNYEYYCDGQLKKEIIEQLPNVRRILYEYETKGACEEEISFKQLTVYPNPADGKLIVLSELFTNEGTVIKLFSMDGQTVALQKVDQLTDRIQLDVSNLPSGNYVVFISDGKDHLTEKVLIFN